MELLTQLHLGLGAFHRAHQALSLQRLRELGECPWSLASGDIRGGSPVAEWLAAAGGRYTLETVSPAGERRYHRIDSIRRVVPYSPDLAELIAIGARRDTPIISFTVTEAGYYLDADDQIDVSQPDLAADVERATQSRPGHTIYGALIAILRARQAADAGPVTLLCCDNLRHNGRRFRQALLQFCDLIKDASGARWIGDMTTCPNSMVDRITPRPDSGVRERVRAATGVDDPAAIVSESYHQWVIENDFADARPAWEAVGVQMVQSVQPYEEAKIRILNGSHSALAWAGTLAGHRYIHQDAEDERVRNIAHAYVTHDVIPSLMAKQSPYPLDLEAYRDSVLARFANAGIADGNQRVAMDGFAKFPGFIAPTLRERLADGAGIDSTAMLAAVFLKFLERWTRGSLPFVYEDQAMDPRAVKRICAASDPLAAFCDNETLFGALRGDGRLVTAVRRASARLEGWL